MLLLALLLLALTLYYDTVCWWALVYFFCANYVFDRSPPAPRPPSPPHTRLFDAGDGGCSVFFRQVKLRPLPQLVATFLGLLEDNRMGVDEHGNYVRVRGCVSRLYPSTTSDAEYSWCLFLYL